MFQCLGLGDSLYQNGSGELEIQLASDSGLEIVAGEGLSLQADQKSPTWQAWTPTCYLWNGASTWTAWSTVGNATISCRYVQNGKTITGNFYIALGSSTSFGTTGIISLSVPVTGEAMANSGFNVIGSGRILDYGVATGPVQVVLISQTKIAFLFTQYYTNVYEAGYVTDSNPFSWGSADKLTGWFQYEAD